MPYSFAGPYRQCTHLSFGRDPVGGYTTKALTALWPVLKYTAW